MYGRIPVLPLKFKVERNTLLLTDCVHLHVEDVAFEQDTFYLRRVVPMQGSASLQVASFNRAYALSVGDGDHLNRSEIYSK